MGEPTACTWVSQSGGDHPKFAVHAGIDNGAKLYVARAHHEGGIIPGKFHMGHTHVYIPYNMKEEAVENYEILVAPPACLSWIEASGGAVPDHALIGGQDPNGEELYIGRVIHNGKVTIGKVHPSHGCVYVAYDGDEMSFTEYEVLTRNVLGRVMNV